MIAKNLQTDKSHKSSYIENKIRKLANSLKPVYINRNPRFYSIRNKLLKNFHPSIYENASIVWDIVHWVSTYPIVVNQSLYLIFG